MAEESKYPMLSHTGLARLDKCPRAYYFHKVIGVKPVTTPTYFRFGSAFHKGIEAGYLHIKSMQGLASKTRNDVFDSMYKPDILGDTITMSMDAIDTYTIEAKADILKAAGSGFDAEGVAEQQTEEMLIEFNLAKDVLKFYWQEHAISDFNRWEIIDIEVFCKYRFPSDRGRGLAKAYYGGYLDMVVRDKATGGIYIVEHKTTKLHIGRGVLDRYDNPQHVGYKWMLQQHINEGKLEGVNRYTPVMGVIYNVIRKSVPRVPALLKKGGLSKAANIDTTKEVYLQAITDNGLDPADYTDILETLGNKPNTYHGREIVFIRPERIADWLYQVQAKWALIRSMRTGKLPWMCNPDSCNPFAGSKCRYNDLCSGVTEIEAFEAATRRVIDQRDTRPKMPVVDIGLFDNHKGD